MRRVFALVVVATLAATLSGCAKLGQIRLASPSSSEARATKKDCAACEKMCAVAGDAEDNADAVAECKADCRKSCR